MGEILVTVRENQTILWQLDVECTREQGLFSSNCFWKILGLFVIIQFMLAHLWYCSSCLWSSQSWLTLHLAAALWAVDVTGRQRRSGRSAALSGITHLKQACCLWMWNLEVSTVFLAAALGSFSLCSHSLPLPSSPSIWSWLTRVDSWPKDAAHCGLSCSVRSLEEALLM